MAQAFLDLDGPCWTLGVNHCGRQLRRRRQTLILAAILTNALVTVCQSMSRGFAQSMMPTSCLPTVRTFVVAVDALVGFVRSVRLADVIGHCALPS